MTLELRGRVDSGADELSRRSNACLLDPHYGQKVTAIPSLRFEPMPPPGSRYQSWKFHVDPAAIQPGQRQRRPHRHASPAGTEEAVRRLQEGQASGT